MEGREGKKEGGKGGKKSSLTEGGYDFSLRASSGLEGRYGGGGNARLGIIKMNSNLNAHHTEIHKDLPSNFLRI